MAKLISEDNKVKTSFELMLLKDKVEKKPGISWISYKIILESSDKKLIYEKQKDSQGAGDYVLALEPVNEISNMITCIESFLKDKNKKFYSFEPLESSFELILERSDKGYSATCWIDAGNVISDHYTWDGLGLRFFTTEENIKRFLGDLKYECGGLLQQAPEDGNA